MNVRFKGQSEYQKSYGVSRSRSASPHRCAPLAGLCSNQMGINREPRLQRRKRLGPGVHAQSCSSLLCPPQHSFTEPIAQRAAPPAASRSCSAHRKKSSLEPRPPTSPGTQTDPESAAGRGPAADSPPIEPGGAAKYAKPRPSKPDSQPQLKQPLTAAPDRQQPSANDAQHALRWRAGLRAGGQRSGSQRSEYHRLFGWKKPAPAASPILTAEQVLHSSSRSVPPFKKHPVPMETEYRRSFRGLVQPTEPRLHKHLQNHQRVPLFHLQKTNKKRREGSEKKPGPRQEAPAPKKDKDTPPPPQVQRGHRMLTEYETRLGSPLDRIPKGGGATDGDPCQAQELRQQAQELRQQAQELRQQASSYRRRAWGANFSRDHLSQLLSEHNALWEPTDTTDSDPRTPCLTSDLCHDADGHSASPVEALDLASCSSKMSSVIGSGSKDAQIKTHTSPPAERRTAWGGGGGGGEEEEENMDEEEGRLPTPRLKIRPVQRTHHDITTPATGGAILVGKLKNSTGSSPHKQRCGSGVSVTDLPVKEKEAWPDNNSSHLSSSGPSPNHKPAASHTSKPIRMKQTPPCHGAGLPLAPPPQHCIQGTLRNADFQHNGELGLRFRELQCSGGCGSDEDDRLSVMSWRSAASCSMAAAVLERTQKRRENFWGKR